MLVVRAGKSESLEHVLEMRSVEVNSAWCAWCADEYYPVEYAPADHDGPNFCSYDCAEAFSLAVAAYHEARYTGAPVD